METPSFRESTRRAKNVSQRDCESASPAALRGMVRGMDTASLDGSKDGCQHECLLYSGDAEFVAETLPFIRAGLDANEPVMVAVLSRKIALLREQLGTEAGRVEFYDMERLGSNPARIIPAWQRFLDARGPSERVRGIGEPVWAGRGAAGLAECHIHEHLLNHVLEATFGFWLICPYDVSALGANVVNEALVTHPTFRQNGSRRPSPGHLRLDGLLNEPPGPPTNDALTFRFDGSALTALRAVVRSSVTGLGLDERAAEDLTLAVSEVAANSVRYGGGAGSVQIWGEDGGVRCEIVDQGQILDPLVGRRQPRPTQIGGRGLWLANQICDLVQIRSGANGTTVRLHVATGQPPRSHGRDGRAGSPDSDGG